MENYVWCPGWDLNPTTHALKGRCSTDWATGAYVATHRNGGERRYFASELPEHISPTGRRFVLGRLGIRFSLASDTPGVSTHVREMTELVIEEGNLHCQDIHDCIGVSRIQTYFCRCDTAESPSTSRCRLVGMDYTIFTFGCQGHKYQIYIIFKW